jgi:CheY-like chemotaxis protein
MPHILAIERDPRRRLVLETFVREHVKADITAVGSVGAAIQAFALQPPDLILAPTLLSPRDSEALAAFVKQSQAAPYVQMVTVAALDMLVEAPTQGRLGLGIFRRRPAALGLQYDPRMVAAQIEDGLDRAREARAEHQVAIARAAWRTATIQLRSETLPAPVPVSHDAQAPCRHDEERRCARRNTPVDVPWLSGIRLPHGVNLDLVNISSSGLLVESGSKLGPGLRCELELNGRDTNLIVNARFIRSEIARVDRLGVKYRAAAEFDRAIDITPRREEPVTAPTSQHPLGALLATVLAEPGHGEPARVRFARGLCQLVRARDVLVRNVPIAPVDNSESVCFHVRGTGPARVMLQVMFEHNRDLTASDFRLLKAGALLMAAVLEFETPLADAPSLAGEHIAVA